MDIYEYSGNKKLACGRCVIALGFFDGVTAAHRELIRKAGEIAKIKGLPLGIFTFPSEDPLKHGSPRLYSTEEKLSLLSGCGADFTVLADFRAISGLSDEEFARDVIIRDIGAMVAVSGYNFRFGRGAMGDAEALVRLMHLYGGEAVTVPEMTAKGSPISSTRIRELLANGEPDAARLLLGVPYFICGRVAHGRSEGRRLGFPTVNIPIDSSRAVLKRGVYRTAIPIGDKIYNGITNVGTCPTFTEREIHTETYILDFDGDLYERELKIYFLGYIRDERRFESEEELVARIAEDEKTAIRENGDLTWQRLGLK
ncbi:MAG: riboflavin biosynthesis protein RibF [Clostridia bacterium]|nr:riboflavin biosynthesis protein RibF [Clostridia bacterium]